MNGAEQAFGPSRYGRPGRRRWRDGMPGFSFNLVFIPDLQPFLLIKRYSSGCDVFSDLADEFLTEFKGRQEADLFQHDRIFIA